MLAYRSRLGILLCVLTACSGQPLAPDGSESTESTTTPMLSSTAVQASCQAAPEGVVAWWRGDGDASDFLGANNGTPVGAVSYASGQYGQAFSFDGLSYLEVADNSALDLANSFTVDFWFAPLLADNMWFEGLIGKRDPNNEVANFGVNMNPTFLGIGPYFNDTASIGGDDYEQVGSLYEAIRVIPTPTPGSFHHFAAVYSQATDSQVELRMYIDGVMVRSRTIGGVLARTVNDAPLTIGASYPGFEAFYGLMDEVRIFNRALSDAEIGSLPTATDLECGGVPLVIDIQPGSEGNSVPCDNPRAMVTVAVLSTETFDATQLDPLSARFGPLGAAEAHAQRHIQDVNSDGRLDLILHFRFGETGLACNATDALLRVTDSQGVLYEGIGAINTDDDGSAMRSSSVTSGKKK